MSLKGSCYFEQHFLFSNPLVQFVLGILPYHSSNNKLFYFYTINFFILPLCGQQLYRLLTLSYKSDTFVDTLQSFCAGLCILCSYVLINTQKVEIKSIIDHIKYDYEQLTYEDELNIFNEYNKQTKTYTYCFLIILHLYFVGVLVPCLLNIILYYIGTSDNVHLTLPFPITKIFNPGTLYYSLLIYQIIALYIYLLLGIICIPTFLSIIQHACCQFCILRLKISEPFRNNKKSNQMFEWNKRFENEFDWIVDIIKHYTRITEFVDMIVSLSKIGYIIVITLMMVIIIFGFVSIFQLSEGINNTSKLVERGCYIGNSIIMTYINFYVGQRLINHNISIFDELCQIPFYKLSIKTQKLLLFVIARSLRPCELSIGDLFASSHEVFSGLMQKAFSFATVYYGAR